MATISKKSAINNGESLVLLCGKSPELEKYGLSRAEADYIRSETERKERRMVTLQQAGRTELIGRGPEHLVPPEGDARERFFGDGGRGRGARRRPQRN